MKLYPDLSVIDKKSYKFFIPLYDQDRIAIRQSLPLYKSPNLLFSLNWRQDIRNTFNLTHIGANVSYKNANGLKIKLKNMTGVSMLTELSIHK